MKIILIKEDKTRLIFNNEDVKMVNLYDIVSVENNNIYVIEIYLSFGLKIIFKSSYFDRVNELGKYINDGISDKEFEISKEYQEEYLIEEYIK